MASIGQGYDLSATTFSPDGRIFQIEYASKAVESSGIAIGLKAKNGIVLAVEKPIINSLVKPKVNKRIFNVDKNAGMVGAGLAADCRALVNRAREECSSHRENFDKPMDGPSLAERISLFMQAYTLYSSVRPFCSQILMATCDDDGHHLHMLEPSGVCWEYRGCVAGRGAQHAKSEIEKLSLSEITATEAVKEAAKIIWYARSEENSAGAGGDDGKDEFEVEISWICEESGNVHTLIPAELLEEAIGGAKAALDARMDI